MAKRLFLERLLSRELDRLADLYSVVVITGPRQSGQDFFV